MDTLRLVGEVRRALRFGFPELYEKHIRGRGRQFIKEYEPLKQQGVDLLGEKIGTVSCDLRWLWAISFMLKEEASNSHFINSDDESFELSELCQGMYDTAMGVLGMTVQALFWRILHWRFCGGIDQEYSIIQIGEVWSVFKQSPRNILRDRMCMSSEMFFAGMVQGISLVGYTAAKAREALVFDDSI